VIPREGHVGQRFVDAFLQGLGRRTQPHVHQPGYHLLGLFLGGFIALLGLDGLEHRGDLGNPFPRHLGQDVPVEVEDAALPVCARQSLVHGLHQSQTLVADHQPDTRKAPGGQVAKELQPALFVLLHALANPEDCPDPILSTTG